MVAMQGDMWCCSNQDHKNKHHAQVHKIYPGKPFSTREKTHPNPLLYSSRERPFTTKNDLAHKRDPRDTSCGVVPLDSSCVLLWIDIVVFYCMALF
jgi:hypothetical protein